MDSIISIKNLSKIYNQQFKALNNISLEIERGEILALLGPNGAGKTTLICAITGIINKTSGTILVDGFDNVTHFRQARQRIGLVPQELTTDAFLTVWNTVSFSRGLFGKPRDDAFIEQLLKELSLWDKRDKQLRTLSGGMKRRVLIAKALSHQPPILFLDEPTAGVDVELRKDMWRLVNTLREAGTTIILTTHYIEEAEEIADRIGVINNGELLLIEDKQHLMAKLGKKQLIIELKNAIEKIPSDLANHDLSLSESGTLLTYTYNANAGATGITALIKMLNQEGLALKELHTTQSTLEDIFVDIVHETSSIAEHR